MTINIIAVVHGKSEKALCQMLSDYSKADIQIYSKTDGEESIKIRDLKLLLSTSPFTSIAELTIAFPLLIRKSVRTRSSAMDVIVPGLHIFSLMDTDDSPIERRSYITGDLVKACPLGSHITTVYDIPNLDAVMHRYGLMVDVNNKVKSYERMLKGIDWLDFYRFLQKDEGTNLDVLVGHCLSRMPSMQGVLV